jgi:cell shape-determining protein MreC
MKIRQKLTKSALLTALVLLSLLTTAAGGGVSKVLRSAAQVVLAPFGDPVMYPVAVLRGRTGDRHREGLGPKEAGRLLDRVDYHRRLENHWRSQAEEYLRRAVLAEGFRAAEQRSRKKLSEDARRFGSLFSPRADRGFELIPARVVAVEALGYGESRLLSVRRSAGAAPGAMVLSPPIVTDRSKALPADLAVALGGKLVGRLTDESQAFTSRMRMLTDPGFGVRALIRRRFDPRRPRRIREYAGTERAAETFLTEQNNRPVPCNIEGIGGPRLRIRGVAAHDNILPGDEVYTYPDGAFSGLELHIGTVVSVEPLADHQGFVEILVDPAAELEGLRDVHVVVPVTLPPPADAGDGPG